MRILSITLYAILISASVFAQYPREGQMQINSFSKLPKGFIIIGASGKGLDVNLTIIDGGRFNTGEQVSVCYLDNIEYNSDWEKISYNDAGCGQCVVNERRGCWVYRKKTPQTIFSSNKNSNTQSNNQNNKSQEPKTSNYNISGRWRHGTVGNIDDIWEIRQTGTTIIVRGKPLPGAGITHSCDNGKIENSIVTLDLQRTTFDGCKAIIHINWTIQNTKTIFAHEWTTDNNCSLGGYNANGIIMTKVGELND